MILKKRPKATKKATKATNIVAFQNFLCRFCRPSKKRQKATSSFVGGHPRLGGSTQKTYLKFFASCVKLIFLKKAVAIFFTDFEALGGPFPNRFRKRAKLRWVTECTQREIWCDGCKLRGFFREIGGHLGLSVPDYRKCFLGRESPRLKGVLSGTIPDYMICNLGLLVPDSFFRTVMIFFCLCHCMTHTV